MIKIEITGETPREIAKDLEALYAKFCVATVASPPVEIDMGEEEPALKPARKKAAAKKTAAKKEEPAPEPTPEPEAEPEALEGEIVEDKDYTLDDVRAAVTKGVASLGPDAVKQLFVDFGAKSGKDLADDKRGHFIQAVDRAIEAGA